MIKTMLARTVAINCMASVQPLMTSSAAICRYFNAMIACLVTTTTTTPAAATTTTTTRTKTRQKKTEEHEHKQEQEQQQQKHLLLDVLAHGD